MNDDALMMVNSSQLRAAAERMRNEEGLNCLRNGVSACPEQLDAAADILEKGPKTQITSATGVTSGTINYDPQERPGWIDASRQEARDVLIFDVGILAETYRITRDGVANPIWLD